MKGDFLLAEARRQLEDLARGREVKLGLVAHKYFMPHLWRTLPDTTANPVVAAASAALKDVERRGEAMRVAQRGERELVELGAVTLQMKRAPGLRCPSILSLCADQAGERQQEPQARTPLSWVKY